MGGAVKSVAKKTPLGMAAGMAGGGGGVKDLLFGKKDPGTPDRFLPRERSLHEVITKAREGQKKTLGLFDTELDRLKDQGKNIDRLADLRVARQEGIARARGEDLKRSAQDMVARRGLGRSAVGLGAILRADEAARKEIGSIRAQRPEIQDQLRQRRLSDILRISQGTGQILRSPGQQRTFIQGQASKGRSGGLLGIGLGVAGGAMAAKKGGDPGQGFMSGMGAGRAIANI